jgi:hypothetical protein
MTPSDLLRSYADMAERHPMTMLSAGGPELQRAFVAFLRTNASADADYLDALTDMFRLVARNLLVVSMSTHHGTACPSCVGKLSLQLGQAIGDELQALVESQSPNFKGIH